MFKLIKFILVVQTPYDRVFRRVRNTMSGMINAALEARIRAALDNMSRRAVQELDESSSRLGLLEDRVVELEDSRES